MRWLIVCSILLTAGNAFAERIDEPAYAMHTLTPAVYPGHDVEYLVLINTNAEVGASWNIYVAGQDAAAKEGTVTNVPQIIRAKLSLRQPGRTTAVMISRNTNGAMRIVGECQFEVKDGLMFRALPMMLGPIIGLMIAFVVYVCKEWQMQLSQKQMLKYRLKQVLRELDDLIEGKREHWKLPDWCAFSYYGDLSHMFLKEPFFPVINHLVEIERVIRMGTAVDDEIRVRADQIRMLLNVPRSSAGKDRNKKP